MTNIPILRLQQKNLNQNTKSLQNLENGSKHLSSNYN